MTPNEITVLLGYAKGLDPLIAVDDLSISAWCNVLPDEITLNEAQRYVREHYQDTDKVLKPAHIVGRHRMFHSPPVPERKPEPTHDCMDGWILTFEERNGMSMEVAAKCPQCTSGSSRLQSA